MTMKTTKRGKTTSMVGGDRGEKEEGCFVKLNFVSLGSFLLLLLLHLLLLDDDENDAAVAAAAGADAAGLNVY